MSINNLLVNNFGLRETLKIQNPDQLKNIRYKIDSIENEFKNKINYLEKDNFIFLKKLLDDCNEEHNLPIELKRKFIKKEIYNNSVMLLFSLTSFFYFMKISNYLNKVNSLKIFKPIFLFTICLAPLGFSLYNSKINWEYTKLHSLNKKF